MSWTVQELVTEFSRRAGRTSEPDAEDAWRTAAEMLSSALAPSAPRDLDDRLGSSLRALAWHDVTCPEGPDCRDRRLHAASIPLVHTGILDRYDEVLLSMVEDEVKRRLATEGDHDG